MTPQQTEAIWIKQLDAAIKELEADYRAVCDHVDWYNNNMPNVGITRPYKSCPPPPEALATLMRLRQDIVGPKT